MCSFFLVWKRRHVSPTYTVFWQLQGILYTTHFCLSPSGSWHVRLISLIFLPGLKATRKQLSCSSNWTMAGFLVDWNFLKKKLFLLFLCFIKQTDSMSVCVCSVIGHRKRQNVVRTSVTHSAITSYATNLFLTHLCVRARYVFSSKDVLT